MRQIFIYHFELNWSVNVLTFERSFTHPSFHAFGQFIAQNTGYMFLCNWHILSSFHPWFTSEETATLGYSETVLSVYCIKQIDPYFPCILLAVHNLSIKFLDRHKTAHNSVKKIYDWVRENDAEVRTNVPESCCAGSLRSLTPLVRWIFRWFSSFFQKFSQVLQFFSLQKKNVRISSRCSVSSGRRHIYSSRKWHSWSSFFSLI